MKMWIKILVSTFIGLALGIFLPDDPSVLAFFNNFSKLVIDIACYVVFPLVFFSVSIAIYELKREEIWIRVLLRTILYLLISMVVFTVLGIASAIIFAPERIPLIIKEQVSYSVPSIGQIAAQIFQRNIFQVFVENGDVLLPLFVFSILLGLNLNFDKIVTRPVVQFFDSFSRVLYHINTFIVEVLGIGTIILASYFVLQIRSTPEFELYQQFVIVLLINAFLVVFLLYPLVLYFIGKQNKPFKQLFGLLGPALSAFFSGDAFFSLATIIKHGKENLGIPRKVGALTFPFYTLFGKAGTALVSSIGFIVIYRSYFSLNLDLAAYLWIGVFSILGSLLTFSFPSLGVIVVISFLSKLYGNGLEDAFLLLKPIIPLMVSIAVFLDVLSNAVMSFLISQHEGVREEVEIRDYI